MGCGVSFCTDLRGLESEIQIDKEMELPTQAVMPQLSTSHMTPRASVCSSVKWEGAPSQGVTVGAETQVLEEAHPVNTSKPNCSALGRHSSALGGFLGWEMSHRTENPLSASGRSMGDLGVRS